MATIVTLYDVNDVVYHVNEKEGVRKVVVKDITITVNPLATIIEYDMQLVDAACGSIEAVEAEVFGDIDSALYAYKELVV